MIPKDTNAYMLKYAKAVVKGRQGFYRVVSIHVHENFVRLSCTRSYSDPNYGDTERCDTFEDFLLNDCLILMPLIDFVDRDGEMIFEGDVLAHERFTDSIGNTDLRIVSLYHFFDIRKQVCTSVPIGWSKSFAGINIWSVDYLHMSDIPNTKQMRETSRGTITMTGGKFITSQDGFRRLPFKRLGNIYANAIDNFSSFASAWRTQIDIKTGKIKTAKMQSNVT